MAVVLPQLLRWAYPGTPDMRELEQSVLPLQKAPQGRLRISAPWNLAISRLPEVLLSFPQQFPRIEPGMHVSGSLVDLVEEGIDVALRAGKLARMIFELDRATAQGPERSAQGGLLFVIGLVRSKPERRPRRSTKPD